MTETISRGPQFKGIASTMGLAVFPFVLIFGIFELAHENNIGGGIIAFTVAALFFFLFLNIRGTEFDFDQKQVRAYQQFIAWRWGEWLPLSHYQEIHLVKDTFYVRQPAFGPAGDGSNASKISTFDVILIAGLSDNDILLSEFEKHSEATAFLKKYSEKLGLPSRDIYRELQASAVSRRAGRR